MQEMRFPLFVDLHDKLALVVGAGKVGQRRMRVLAEFGAQVVVVDPRCESLEGIDELRLQGVSFLSKSYDTADIEGAYLCVAATDNRTVNAQVVRDAAQAGVLVNVADDSASCDFYFPAICRSEDMVAGVVSVNKNCSKTRQIAQRIRALLRQEGDET